MTAASCSSEKVIRSGGSPMYGCIRLRSVNVSPSIQLRTSRPCSSMPSHLGAAPKPARSRCRRTSRISCERRCGGFRTVSPTRTTPSAVAPPESGISSFTAAQTLRSQRSLGIRGSRLLKGGLAPGACQVGGPAAARGRGALEARVRASPARAGRVPRPPLLEAAVAASPAGRRDVSARARTTRSFCGRLTWKRE
jgi:hypothetical protein